MVFDSDSLISAKPTMLHLSSWTSISAIAYEVNEATIKVQSSSVLLVKLEGTVLVGTLLGTVVTVLVAWTGFWYKVGSPTLGTKSVGTIGTILTRERQK